ncbi:NIF3-like protein 1 [Lamellibrachia satsuma]|nr:NIF3-like protein 1 [Lamellibrachia satsuma]
MQLNHVVKKLESFAANSLAAKWDNVGLLVEPSSPHTVSRMLLTNDLTEPVLDEAIRMKTDFILSYHPPIFAAVKRLLQSSWKERLLVKCIENRIAVFSPHTSYDALNGGVNDWLISPFKGVVSPLETSVSTRFPGNSGGYRLQVTLPQDVAQSIMAEFALRASLPGVSVVMQIGVGVGSEYNSSTRICLNCDEKSLTQCVAYVNQFEHLSNTMEIMKLTKPPLPGYGAGRLSVLEKGITLKECIDKTKHHLDLKNLRLALAIGANLGSPIKTVAVCAGSGASVLKDVSADLYITGEMGHHDVLHATQSGTCVILCEHTNTERGYLTELRDKLEKLFGPEMMIVQSKADAEPLVVI